MVIRPFLGLFGMLKKVVNFRGCFGNILTKVVIFYEIKSLDPKFQQIFVENSAFFTFSGLATLEHCTADRAT
jgi:hypothetical protein